MKQLEYIKTINLFGKYGIPFAKAILVKDIKNLHQSAKKIKYPLAMKIISQQLVHKTELKGVRLNIKSDEELLKNFNELEKIAKTKLKKFEGILLQKMYSGKEVIIGMKKDSQFGPVIMFGLGGIFVEVLKDISLRICPVDKKTAIEMIKEIKGIKILEGARGEKPARINLLADIIVKLSRLSFENKKISEIDLNPVIVNENNAVIVDARMIENGA